MPATPNTTVHGSVHGEKLYRPGSAGSTMSVKIGFTLDEAEHYFVKALSKVVRNCYTRLPSQGFCHMVTAPSGYCRRSGGPTSNSGPWTLLDLISRPYPDLTPQPPQKVHGFTQFRKVTFKILLDSDPRLPPPPPPGQLRASKAALNVYTSNIECLYCLYVVEAMST